MLTVEIDGLRDDKGVVRLCLTSRADSFPQCKSGALSASVAVHHRRASYRFTGVAPGTYAIAAFHDANRNAKLDKMMGMPREGFAFSRNPPIRPRAPTFAETRVTIGGDTTERLRMRYLL